MANPVPDSIQIPAAQSQLTDGLTQSQKPAKDKKKKVAAGSAHPLEVRFISPSGARNMFQPSLAASTSSRVLRSPNQNVRRTQSRIRRFCCWLVCGTSQYDMLKAYGLQRNHAKKLPLLYLTDQNGKERVGKHLR
jgi:hypothetical protein